jgi:hypothetical protein
VWALSFNSQSYAASMERTAELDRGNSHIDFVSWGHALRMGLEPLEKYKDPKIDKNLDELLKKEIKSPF